MSERDELRDVILHCPPLDGVYGHLDTMLERVMDWHERNREKKPQWCAHIIWINGEFKLVGGTLGFYIPWNFCPECGAKRP